MAKRGESDLLSWYRTATPIICPLCGREIPAGFGDEHHLVPRLKGGKITQYLHRICHRQIHALFSESELAQKYPTVDALLEQPEIRKFAQWIKNKPIGFLDGPRPRKK